MMKIEIRSSAIELPIADRRALDLIAERLGLSPVDVVSMWVNAVSRDIGRDRACRE